MTEGTPATAEVQYSYCVTFDLNGGSAAFDPIYTGYNGRIALPENEPDPPADSLNTFAGWYTEKTGGELITAEQQFTGNSA